VWKSATSRMGSRRPGGPCPNQLGLLGKSQIGALSERHGQESARVYSSLFSLFDFIPLPVHAALLVGGSRTLERLSRNDLWEIKENRLSQPKVIAIALTDRSPPCCFSSRSPLSSALRFPSRNLRVVPPNVGTQTPWLFSMFVLMAASSPNRAPRPRRLHDLACYLASYITSVRPRGALRA
jgi:hypothetical protein